MKQVRMKHETRIIQSCFRQAWYDGSGSIDGGEPNCPCCSHITTDDDFGRYECAADTCIEPIASGIPEGCPLEDVTSEKGQPICMTFDNEGNATLGKPEHGRFRDAENPETITATKNNKKPWPKPRTGCCKNCEAGACAEACQTWIKEHDAQVKAEALAPLKSVQERFSHLDKCLSDPEWCQSGEGSAIYGIAGEMWRAIKEATGGKA